MKLSEYVEFDGMGLAELVRRGEVTASELLDLAQAAIDQVNPQLNAVIRPLRELAERDLAHGLAPGPFAGVPFLVKDLGVACAGVPTSMGSRLFANAPAPWDTELMQRYRRAGLLVMGKTNLPELGLSFTTEPVLWGATRNPWDVGRSPGGSSGGSAAAVAARLVPMAHGSDAAGSLRVPASCCGLFGLKPTRGRTPTGPMAGELIFGLGIEHAVTRSVRDSAALLDATVGEDPGAPYGAPAPTGPFLAELDVAPKRLRIAVQEQAPNGTPVHHESITAVRRAAALCEELGHEVVMSWPNFAWGAFQDAFRALVSAFVADLCDGICPAVGLAPGAQTLEPMTLAIAAHGRKMSSNDLAGALRQRDFITRAVGQWFTDFDLLLTPTLAAPPPPLGTLRLYERGDLQEAVFDRLFAFAPFTPLANLTGNPAMSVPLHATPEGLPIGVQFVGRFADERTLFRLAAELERAAPWQGSKPPLVVR